MGFGVRVTVVDVLDETIIAGADTASVGEGSVVTINTSTLLSNDVHAEGAALTVVSVQDAVNGTILLNMNRGRITYRHDGSETTTGSFTYTASDGTRGANCRREHCGAAMERNAQGDGRQLADQPGREAGRPGLRVAQQRHGRGGRAAHRYQSPSTPTMGGSPLTETTVTYQHDGSLSSTGGFNYIVSDGSNTSSARVSITIVWAEDATGLFSIGDPSRRYRTAGVLHCAGFGWARAGGSALLRAPRNEARNEAGNGAAACRGLGSGGQQVEGPGRRE